MNETHFWLLLAMVALSLLCAWFYLYLTAPEPPATTVPPATDRYIRELQQARRQKALKAAQRTLEEVGNG